LLQASERIEVEREDSVWRDAVVRVLQRAGKTWWCHLTMAEWWELQDAFVALHVVRRAKREVVTELAAVWKDWRGYGRSRFPLPSHYRETGADSAYIFPLTVTDARPQILRAQGRGVVPISLWVFPDVRVADMGWEELQMVNALAARLAQV
jgi:hypothetical protein